MAFEQNSVPIHLRPINVARVVPEDANGRNVEGFVADSVQNISSPNTTPVYYPVALAETGGISGEASGNMNNGIPNLYQSLPVGMAVGGNPAFKCSSSANLVNQGGNRECKNDCLSSGKKPKFLCSFGGKILPRPGSGVLRYVGGHTRLISFNGNINFANLTKKMVETCEQPVTIKYQLPGEDLDTLVSIACQEDFDIMMEEYDNVINSLPDGSARLRLYLFPTSEADSSGLATLSGFIDNGQKYIEAVNGILDEPGSVFVKKESLEKAASAENSNLGGAEATDYSGQAAQRNFVELPTTGASSPKENSRGGMSQENTPSKVAVQPLSSNMFDASAVRLGIPLTDSSVQISNCEVDLEKSVFPTVSQQMAFETKQEVPTSTSYTRACVPHRQDIEGTSESVQFSSQIGFGQPPSVGNPVSVFQQHQLLENGVSASPKQFMPAMPTSAVPQAVLRPNAVQQIMYPSQVRQDNYPAGVAYPMRMFSRDPSYCGYPTQVLHSVIGGAYAWNTAIPNHTLFHEGLALPQQVLYTAEFTKLDDCYMRQKALPHAHSDSLAQQLKDGIETPTSDSNRSFHSLQSEVNVQTQLSNMACTVGVSKEVCNETSCGAQSSTPDETDNQATTTAFLPRVSQKLDTRPENEKITHLMTENLNRSKLPVSQGVLVSGGCVPYSAPINNMLQQHSDISAQHCVAPAHFEAKQNALVSNGTYIEAIHTANLPSQTSEHLRRPSPKEISGKFPGAVLKENILDASTDSFKQPNQSSEALHVSSCENVINSEFGKFDGPFKNELLDQKPQQIAGRDTYVDTLFNKGNIAFEKNQTKQTQSLSNYSQELQYITSQPTESYALLPKPITGYAVERPSGTSAWMDDASQGSSSLFSNQDPLIARPEWTMPPHRPNPTAVKNEANFQDHSGGAFLKNSDEANTELRLEDVIQLPSANMTNDSIFEHGPSEEFVRHQLQGVGDSVATSNLHASPPPPLNTDLLFNGVQELLSKATQESGELNNDSKSQKSPKIEDIKAKLSDKANFGFPSSNLGRLQIINNNDLEELCELGSGTFGTVYHGKWRGTDVAIKRINNRCFRGKPSEQEQMRHDFWNEAIKLADLHHPNVLAFYGVVLDGPGGSVATVTEHMVNGSLRTALQKNWRNLDKRKRILIATDVAFGMEYLHGKNIVHFDLKSDNLLVNLRDPHRPICKVGDLGLSKVKCHTLISGGVRGTLPWMAPELLNGSSSLVSEKVDVFSFGIVLWELITGEEPYADLHYGAIIGGIVSNTLRPSIPESCDPEWRSLMERCWSSDPSERPSFIEIANQLRAMATNIPPNGQNSGQPPIQK